MTPAPARARSIILTVTGDHWVCECIAEALDKAGIGFTEKGEAGWTVEQEREACAKIAAGFESENTHAKFDYTLGQHDGRLQAANVIAAVIRARQTPTNNEPPAKETERQDLAAEKNGSDSRAVLLLCELALDFTNSPRKTLDRLLAALDRFEANTGRST